MSTETEPAEPGLLSTCVQASHDRTLAALTGDECAPLHAVVWASAHLAAMDHVLLPLGHRAFSEDPAHRPRANRLHDLLRRLESHHCGDAAESLPDAVAVRAATARAFQEHAAAEAQLCARLEQTLTTRQQEQAAADYRHALAAGPTRPHPHSPDHGVLGSLAYRVNALRDRAMDVMDGRTVPAAELAQPRRTKIHKHRLPTPSRP